jgi:malonyl-CoA decarboxylase
VDDAQVRNNEGRARPLFRRILRTLARSRAEPKDAGARQARQIIQQCRALLSEPGEVSRMRLASELLSAYKALDKNALEPFFDLLVEDFSPDPETLHQAADAYVKDPTRATLLQLRTAVESPRQELFRRFNMVPGGMAVLVAMRGRLLQTLGDHPERAGVDADLEHLFRSWFSRGFLLLQRIDWHTPAVVLERIIQYEAVHQIHGWRDLRRRLEADRRCYAFFHPALPDEPLIFIEIALTRGMGAKVQPLLDADAPVVDPATTDCATFYSITNCQEGLRGVSFGNLLIKQVVADLGHEFPRVKTFATLSPVPGFCEWLASSAGSKRRSPELATLWQRVSGGESIDQLSISTAVRNEITRLCAFYLLHAKWGKAPLDPVARFHLTNGARLQRLNWMGDTSNTGLQRSLGLMVNYQYRLADVERNHEMYAKDYRIAASRELERAAAGQ